jgi:D-xylose transport system substrate-binding protein
MKQYILFVLIGLTLLINSCNFERNAKVGLLLHDVEGRWIKELEYLKQIAEEEGIQLIVKSAGNDENVQINQVEELIDEGVGALLVVAVNQNTSAAIVRRAHKAKVPVIGYDRLIRFSDLDFLITYDYFKVGELMVDYAVQRVPRGNYVIFWGDGSDANAVAIQNRQTEMLKPYVDRGDINIIYKTHVEGWSDAYAKMQMDKVLSFSNKPIDVILASNDVIANSVLDVFDLRQISQKPLVTGQDATLEGCQSVVRKRQTMTVYKSTVNMARTALVLAKKLSLNQRVEIPEATTFNGRKQVPTVLLQPTVTDATNMMSTVISDGVFTKDEVYDPSL